MSDFDLHERASGVLLHPTSLPGPYGSGDVGPEAARFADWLRDAGQRWWQMLPVGPVGFGNSPYSALSAFAGNTMLVSIDALVADGFVDASALERPRLPREKVDFARVAPFRERVLRAAFDTFERRPGRFRRRYERFREANDEWLDDWALYAALKRANGQRAWVDWPEALRSRDRRALSLARRHHGRELDFERFAQWIFDEQWRLLREACHERGIGLIGDVPIFAAHDSADVWANQELWFLDERGRPTVIAGVPPDYFSETGQRWGNPLYRWDLHRRRGYAWWIARFRKTLERFDAVRLDHFIGFQRYWEIPADEPTAVKGRWRPGPREHFFEKVRHALGEVPFIAEDLGAVTPEVKALRDEFEFPGLRILQFAFGNDPSAPDFVPFNYSRNSVVYTGTHDNDTTVGWFHGGDRRSRAQVLKEQRAALDFVGGDPDEIHWSMLRTAMLSVANLCIAPMQDLLGLGSEARMNRPGEPEGNWGWRMPGQPTRALAQALKGLTRLSGRLVEERAAAPVRRPPRTPRGTGRSTPRVMPVGRVRLTAPAETVASLREARTRRRK